MTVCNRLAAAALIGGCLAPTYLRAQTGPDHVLTPAPVPSVAPGTAGSAGTGTIPDRIAPGTGDAGAPSSLSAGPTNATPFSGVPSSLNSGTNQASPGGSQLGRDTLTPNLSK